MRLDTGQMVRLSDYKPTPYAAPHTALTFRLAPKATRVENVTRYVPRSVGESGPLVLAGDELTFEGAELDGKPLAAGAFEASADKFVLHQPPQRAFELRLTTTVAPAKNTELMGLYRSGGIYCTQCEAEGFRRITYAYDRPDVLGTYETTIIAENATGWTLLSNGNPAEEVRDGTTVIARWFDPHPKPSYLFALVAGRLAALRDSFVTASGREVALAIYVEPGKEEKARYAMDVVKRAMGWDEEAFGREYDLDVFNIVAVPDFNMGAMENKGLNIFNDRYVLADPTSATDADYAGIETVVAHEYLHNWTGNRITCRDWFQLCLKEGLTVFRDQEFTGDVRSAAVKRIEDVRRLRMTQFREDASPLRHAVRPREYGEISNLYTPTVYEKGAEIIRLIQTILGKDAFTAGMTRYFERFDGSAATVEDFLSGFEGLDVDGFMRWYEEPGTPCIQLEEDFEGGRYSLTIRQLTPEGASPKPIPVRLKLFAQEGPLDLSRASVEGATLDDDLLLVGEAPATLTLDGLTVEPAASWLRGFSAPVGVDVPKDDTRDLRTLLRDDDPVNIWDAAQRVLLDWLKESYREDVQDLSLKDIAAALAHVALEEHHDPAFRAAILQVPSRVMIYDALASDIDPDRVELSYSALVSRLGELMRDPLRALRAIPPPAPDDVSSDAAGLRALRNIALHLLVHAGERSEALDQARNCTNMTDRLAALASLAAADAPEADIALADFHDQVEADPLILDKYFALQAGRPGDKAVSRTQELMFHPRFSLANPNRVRAVVGAFSRNLCAFHRADGSGYSLVGEAIATLDRSNPQLAARLMTAFADHAAMEEGRRQMARAAIEEVAKSARSSDVADIVRRLTAAQS